MADDDLSPRKVGQYYDDWTARYRSSFGDTFQACRPTNLADLHQYILERSGIRDGERVLDAGCGVCGPSLFFAAHRDISIDAVTVSDRQVTTACHLIAEAGLDARIRVHLADFSRLGEQFPADTFDRVLFLESLSHAADPVAPLQGVYDVLKPGGVVYIKDFFEKSFDTEEDRRRVREVIARVDRTFVLRTPQLRHTVAVLEQIGFQELSTEPVLFPNDTSVWSSFDDAHRFDIYGGGEPFQWCDWIELKFQKPEKLDR